MTEPDERRSRRPRVRAAAGIPPPQPGLRLHRLQAHQPDAPRRQADARRRASPDYGSYIDYLEVHPEEFGRLFDTILINVTAFFRDPSAWEAVADEVIPRILAGKRPEDPIRVWSAGCASGEEAYTLAMVLAEALGIDAFRDRVKIYATDVDEEALARARHGRLRRQGSRRASPPSCWRSTSRRTTAATPSTRTSAAR